MAGKNKSVKKVSENAGGGFKRRFTQHGRGPKKTKRAKPHSKYQEGRNDLQEI